MRFTKMHGAGNDYVFLNLFDQPVPDDIPELCRRMSDRHTGVGSDGLILVEPSATADARMRMFNRDGTEAEMCGNGIRCVAKYVYERLPASRKNELQIETARGTLSLLLHTRSGSVDRVRVNMGRPILEAAHIPTTLTGNPPVDAELSVGDSILRVTCVSMGNPHCIVFGSDLSDEYVFRWGPLIEKHPAFPNRVNVEFVRVDERSEITVRVWERGCGETQACGTGACAAVVAGVLTGRTSRGVRVRLPGGELELEWDEPGGNVFLTGPAVEVFTGEWPLEPVV